VTGSKYQLELDNKKVLIDCGLFQGAKELRLRNWDHLPVKPAEIDFIIITHAHIDHTGYLPRVLRDGFRGKIICTHATEALMKIMLKDAAKLQEEEAIFAFKRGYSKHKKPEPLFTAEDAEAVLDLVESHPLEKKVDLFPSLSVIFHNAGHILGSAFIEARIKGNSQEKTIVFSGDLGRYDDPLMYPPVSIDHADVLLIESTYGDRINPMQKIEDDLTTIVQEAYKNNGAIVIPAFAVGRTQNLIYYFHKLMENKSIPTLPIYIDSPMAIRVTDLYETLGKHISLFDAPNIQYCNTQEMSKSLNAIKNSCIIISASGMCTGGRILHHLAHRLPRENDTFLFAGYQAEGTRGRDILEGEKSIRVFGEDIPVNCHVREVHGLSAHADQSELLQWLGNFKKAPKMVFMIHGEEKVMTDFAKSIEKKLGWKAIIPEYLESVVLFQGI
jgi:metallo-beta-lactamase family protein